MSFNVSRRVVVAGGTVVFLVLLLVLLLPSSSTPNLGGFKTDDGRKAADEKVLAEQTVHRIAFVTDLDHASKDTSATKTFWKSYYREATLTRNSKSGKYSVVFDSVKSQSVLRTRVSLDGRGMELSWLCSFNGNLYTGDDRAGVDGKAAARYILADGNGREEKGFKSEWAAVKDGAMYVGSFGKEWSNDDGEFINNNPMWVKVIDRFGGIKHIDWTNNFNAIRAAAGYQFPGYLFHEAALWSDSLKRWIFVPRRTSKERYSPELDETKGGKLIILADETFTKIDVKEIGIELSRDGINPKGFSEIKAVPGRPREIVALRSMEYNGVTKSWLSVFTVDGEVLMPDVFIDDFKFEGLEFI